MAGKSGGAWKVAYADFVTAMMAFFMVMWLCAQDLKVRQSVAKYFMDPSGSTNKPVRTGSVVERPSGGKVPTAENVVAGRGQAAFSPPEEESSPATTLFTNWLMTNDKAYSYWQKQAEESRKAAALSPEVLEDRCSIEECAVVQLSKQMLLELVVAGKANKVMAHQLQVSEKNIEYHRANIMRKMQAKSFAELIRMVIQVSESRRE